MYKRYYDGYGTTPRSDLPQKGEVIIPRSIKDIPPEPEVYKEKEAEADFTENSDLSSTGEVAVADAPDFNLSAINTRGIFDNIGIDDIILIGVIVIMLKEKVDDTLLLVILAAIFIFGFID